MKKFLTVPMLWFLIAIAIVIWLASIPAKAGDDHHNGGDTSVDTSVNTSVETVLNGGDLTGGTQKNSSKALGLSNSLGDVDIAGCLGSTQYGTPVWSKQRLDTNWFCVAEFYIRAGKYPLAAMAMCNTDVRNEFATEDECRAAHDFTPMLESVVIVEAPDEHQEEIEYLYEQVEALTQQVNKPVVTQRVVQQPFLNDKKRAALAEVVK
jgi:hypothetical protein